MLILIGDLGRIAASSCQAVAVGLAALSYVWASKRIISESLPGTHLSWKRGPWKNAAEHGRTMCASVGASAELVLSYHLSKRIVLFFLFDLAYNVFRFWTWLRLTNKVRWWRRMFCTGHCVCYQHDPFTENDKEYRHWRCMKAASRSAYLPPGNTRTPILYGSIWNLWLLLVQRHDTCLYFFLTYLKALDLDRFVLGMEDINTLESIASWALQQAVRLDWWAAPPLASLSETSLEHWSAWRLEMKLLHFPDEKKLHWNHRLTFIPIQFQLRCYLERITTFRNHFYFSKRLSISTPWLFAIIWCWSVTDRDSIPETRLNFPMHMWGFAIGTLRRTATWQVVHLRWL